MPLLVADLRDGGTAATVVSWRVGARSDLVQPMPRLPILEQLLARSPVTGSARRRSGAFWRRRRLMARVPLGAGDGGPADARLSRR